MNNLSSMYVVLGAVRRDCPVIERSAVLLGCAVLFVGSAIADPIPATWKPDPNFPDFYQKDPAVKNGACACAPVSATDSLFWLAGKYNLPNLKTKGGATWQAVTNTLEGATYMNTKPGPGTYSGSFASGIEKYIDAAGYQNRVSVETMLGGSGSPPTIAWIEQQVAAGQDVEILIGGMTNNGKAAATWDGGHYVAVTGYNQNNLLIADPWTDNNNNGEDLKLDGSGLTTLNFGSNGNSKPAYTQTYARVGLDDGLNKLWGAQYDIIFAAVAESPIPEPSSVILLGSGLVLAGVVHRRRRKSPQKF